MKFSARCILAFATLANLVEGHDHHHHHRHLESGGRKCGAKIPTDEDRARAAAVSRKWASRKAAFSDVEIEVFVHVITDESGNGALTMTNVMDTLDHLNSAYSGTGFSFVLRGATCTENDSWFNGDAFGSEITQMKSALRQGDEKTINIYFKDFTDGTLGYAVFPDEYTNNQTEDGIVMLSNQYTSSDAFPYDEGDTLVHEIGHWMGLYHVFNDGFGVFPFRYCLFGRDNDLVNDTPKSFRPTYGCPNSKNSCRLARGSDPISNYMDYSDDACLNEFTDGQIERMQAQWMEYRASGNAVTTENLPDGDLCPGRRRRHA